MNKASFMDMIDYAVMDKGAYYWDDLSPDFKAQVARAAIREKLVEWDNEFNIESLADRAIEQTYYNYFGE